MGRARFAATTIGEYALFAGGSGTTTTSIKSVDAYNTSLIKSTPTDLSMGRARFAATTVGNYALFAGGIDSNTYSNVVDVYTIE